MFKRPLPEAGFRLLNEFGQTDRRLNVTEGIVRMLMHNAVRLRQMFELETDTAASFCFGIRMNVLPKRPRYSRAAQRPNGTGERINIPAGAAVFPLMGIRIEEVSPEQKS